MHHHDPPTPMPTPACATPQDRAADSRVGRPDAAAGSGATGSAAMAARAQRHERGRLRGASLRSRSQASVSRTGMAVAAGASSDADVSGPKERSSSPAPPAQDGGEASGSPSRACSGRPQGSHLPYLPPFVCDAPSRERERLSIGAGAPRTPRCFDNDDRHARPEPRPVGSGEPGRSPGRRAVILPSPRTRGHRRAFAIMRICIEPGCHHRTQTRTVTPSRIARSSVAETSGVMLQSPHRWEDHADLSNTC